MKLEQILIDCIACRYYVPDKNILTALRHRCNYRSKEAIETGRGKWRKKPNSVIFNYNTKECVK